MLLWQACNLLRTVYVDREQFQRIGKPLRTRIWMGVASSRPARGSGSSDGAAGATAASTPPSFAEPPPPPHTHTDALLVSTGDLSELKQALVTLLRYFCTSKASAVVRVTQVHLAADTRDTI